jgi:hypothetical protein
MRYLLIIALTISCSSSPFFKKGDCFWYKNGIMGGNDDIMHIHSVEESIYVIYSKHNGENYKSFYSKILHEEYERLAEEYFERCEIRDQVE